MSKKILVVEDELALSTVIKRKIELQGLDVTVANSVESALSILADEQIDAIWLDHYLLGQKNGLDLVRALKESKEWNSIPIYVVSNTASPDKMQTYMELDVEKYFVKAENTLEEIIDSITKQLNTQEK